MDTKGGFNKTFDNFRIRNNILIGDIVEFPTNGKHIGQIIYDKFNKHPEHVGHIDAVTGRKVTWAETQDQSVKLAVWLQEQGLKKGDFVAVSSYDQINAYLPFLSTLYLGGVINPWPLELTLKIARHLIHLTQPKFIFTCINNAQVLQEAAQLEQVSVKLVIIEDHSSLITLDQILKMKIDTLNFKLTEVDDEKDTAVIFFTSGSTGLPKGAVFTYEAFYHNVMHFEDLANTLKVLTMMNITPVSWLSGLNFYLNSILKSLTRVLLKDFDPEIVCKTVEKYEVNFLFLKPPNFVELVQSGVLQKYQMKSLVALHTGGSKINNNAFKQAAELRSKSLVIKGYGMSEIGTVCNHKKNIQNISSSGTIRSNMEIKIQDRDTQESLGPNKQGEILVKSPYSMSEYYKNTIMTKETITEDGWLHSGDIGYYDENGELYVTDRIKDLIKFRGYHVVPSEIEDKLSGHPDVLSIAVVSYPHDINDEMPIAFVQKRPGSSLTKETLINMSEKLGDYKKLRGGVVFLEKFPLTASGKINKSELRYLARSHAKS